MRSRTLSRMTEEEARRLREYRAKKRGGPPREPKPHGTSAAALRHARAREPQCELCAPVWADYQHEQHEKRKAKKNPPKKA